MTAAASRPLFGGSLVLPLIALMIAVALAVWPSLLSLEHYWRTISTYEHSYLIAIIALVWLLYAARRAEWLTGRHTMTGAVLLAVALYAWLVAFTAHVNIIHQVLTPAVLWCAVLAVIGWPRAGSFLQPVAFLYFAIPVWDYLIPGLQRLCVVVTQAAMHLLSVPARIQDNMVTIPDGTFAIVEGCSGLRYLMISLAVAYLARAMFGVAGRRALLLFAVTVALALIANWLRIAIIIYAGHVSHMQSYLVAVEHLTLGNILFVPLLAAILLLARALSRATKPTEGTTTPGAGRRFSGASVAVLLLMGAWLFQWREAAPPLLPVALEPLPLSTGRWQGPFPSQSGWRPSYPGAAAEATAAYIAGDGTTVSVYVNCYGQQTQSSKLTGFANRLVPTLGWSRKWSSSGATLALAGSPTLHSDEFAGADGHNWLVFHAYRIGGWITHFELAAQLAYGVQSVLNPVPAGVVAFAIQCGMNCQSAQRVAADFWSQMSGPMQRVIPVVMGK